MRACLLVLICAFLALPVLALPLQNADQAVKTVEANLLPGGLKDQVVLQVWGPVSAGTQINGTKEHILVTPAEGYVIYIDDFPTANLFHPVRYAFVETATGKITVIPAKSPPLNQEQYTQVSTAIGDRLMAAENYRAKPTEPLTGPGPTRGDRYAVLMNGGYNSSNNHVRYWNDLSNIYITLNSTYGYADDHIIVLCSDGTNPAPDQSNGLNSNPDLDGDGDADIMFSCVLSNVDMVFGQLANILTVNDKLFIFTTDHGGPVSGWSVIENLWNMEELSDTHFAQLLAALPRCEIICTLEPCNSGGFLDDIVVAPGPIVASSACSYDESSWAMPPDYVYDTYVFHWTAAVKGRDAYGVMVDADYNQDGVITMDEAYQYALTHDQSAESPQYGDYPHGFGAGVSLWPTGTGPFLVVADKVIDDIGGNNNNAPDPGETCSMVVTLSNVGQGEATNIVGTLSTTDPYLTITQNTANYPNLGHFQQGQGAPAYMFNVSSTCPQGQNVTCSLHITADSAYSNDVAITFVVGDPLNSPTGPDAYGYRAYDPYDLPELPVYNWVEISADSGGSGTMIAFTSDDQVFNFDLPFSFRYYGQNFTRFTVGANGWVSMGDVTADDYSNSGIPNTDGPEAMIAAYWEDLSPQRTNSGKVWQRFDAANHRLIVEYNHIEQYAPTGNFETFQVILFDPAYYPTQTGDGRIKVQYKQISASAQTEGTIGIENFAETDGLQYFFDGTRDSHAHAITNSFAILYTTATGAPPQVWDINTSAVTPPVVIPANGGSFQYNINVHNLTTQSQTGTVWNKVRDAANVYTQVFGPVSRTLPGGANPSRVFTQTIAGSISSGTLYFISYIGTYPSTISDSSFFTITKLTTGNGGPFIAESYGSGDFFDEYATTTAVIPEEYSLGQNFPNPFNPLTSISFGLPQTAQVKLTVFDVMGREVTVLVNGMRDAGSHSVTFDALGLASGIYLYKLEAGGFTEVQKMVLMK